MNYRKSLIGMMMFGLTVVVMNCGGEGQGDKVTAKKDAAPVADTGVDSEVDAGANVDGGTSSGSVMSCESLYDESYTNINSDAAKSLLGKDNIPRRSKNFCPDEVVLPRIIFASYTDAEVEERLRNTAENIFHLETPVSIVYRNSTIALDSDKYEGIGAYVARDTAALNLRTDLPAVIGKISSVQNIGRFRDVLL